MADLSANATYPLLEVRDLKVSFGPVRVLHGVGLKLWAGEVHGLLGANGSGKSTIIKALAGFYPPESGSQLMIAGQPRDYPKDAAAVRECRMSFVHQDLGLVNDMTVLENLRAANLTVFPRNRWRISWKAEADAARAMIERFGIDLPLHRKVRSLSVTERATLAICRAVWNAQGSAENSESAAGTIIVLDEPTTSLPSDQIAHLQRVLRAIADHGNAVLIVTHDLEEAIAMTDRISVLRDGRVSTEIRAQDATVDLLVNAIVGEEVRVLALHAGREDRDPGSSDSQARPDSGPPALQVRFLSGRSVRDVNFDVEGGEVVGLAGLPGSGYEDVIPLIYGTGDSDRREGEVIVDGRVRMAQLSEPAYAVVSGLSYLPADRQVAGSCQELSMEDNIVMPVIRRYFRHGSLRWRAVASAMQVLLRDFQVRPAMPHMRFGSFSGGNQQKALLARSLTTKPLVLLLEEPTQGVDVGARYQIHAMIRESASAGTAVLCASTDYDQLARLCDRVLLFRNGVIAANLRAGQLTKDAITAAAHQPVAAGS